MFLTGFREFCNRISNENFARNDRKSIEIDSKLIPPGVPKGTNISRESRRIQSKRREGRRTSKMDRNRVETNSSANLLNLLLQPWPHSLPQQQLLPCPGPKLGAASGPARGPSLVNARPTAQSSGAPGPSSERLREHMDLVGFW